MTKKRHKSPLVVPPTPSLDVEVRQPQVPEQDHVLSDQAQVPGEQQVLDQAEVLDQAHVVPDQVQVPAEPQVVADQPQTVPEQAQAVPEQHRLETDRIEMEPKHITFAMEEEPKHITFAKEEASDKVEPSADKVMCMAPPTAAGGEEPVLLQNTGRFSLSLSSGRSVGTTRRKAPKQKPLYKWELPAEEREALEASMRSAHVTTEHGDFRPGEHPGYFHRERDDASIDASDDRSTASKAVTVLDFQIVLSEAEYRTLQSRRQSLSRRRGLAVGPLPIALTTPGSLCTSGGGAGERREGVMASSPYIDPWRVEKDIHRPAHKDNWMSPVGFTC